MCGVYAEGHKKYEDDVKKRRRTLSNYAIHPDYVYVNQDESFDKRYDVMLLFLDKPYSDVKSFPQLYGCTELLYDTKTKKRIEIETTGIGCGYIPRNSVNITADGMQYNGKEPQVIPITAFQDETFCVGADSFYRDQ